MAKVPVSPTTSTQYRWSSKNPADRFPVEDPATGEVIDIVQGGGAAEIDGAVQAADDAFHRDWRWRPSQERARRLFQCADVLERHADELATLVSKENGKPIADARQHDVNTLIGVFRFFASLTDKLPSEFSIEAAPIRLPCSSHWASSARSFRSIGRRFIQPTRSRQHWRSATPS